MPGKDYLKPEFNLIIDDMIDTSEQKKLQVFLEKWINKKINLILKSLIDLKNYKDNKSNIRALSLSIV